LSYITFEFTKNFRKKLIYFHKQDGNIK